MPEHIRQEPKVLVSTENLTEQEWLAYRRRGIGGSDVAAILGISPFRTARDLYDDKLNIASAVDDAGNWVALEMGHLLEPLVAQIFAKKTGLEVFQIKKMFQHPQYPFMLADVDYFVRLPNGKIAIFRVHDRVMQTKNTEKVSNGDLGFITGITTNSKGERLVQMDFGGDRKMNYTAEQLAHVDLAYATTIHKAMGSEFETVIIPIVKAHTIMLYRNLLYTAVTRAKKKVILVGHKPILFMAVHRADISKRNTMLGERIRLYCKAYNTERNALPELQQAG